MNQASTNPKVASAFAILKVRGYSELNQDQIKSIHDLAVLDDLSPVEIANEIDNAPAQRRARAVKDVRTKTSAVFSKLSALVAPKE